MDLLNVGSLSFPSAHVVTALFSAVIRDDICVISEKWIFFCYLAGNLLPNIRSLWCYNIGTFVPIIMCFKTSETTDL